MYGSIQPCSEDTELPLLDTSRKPAPPPRLRAGDWIEIALQTLKDGGLESVQITALSKQLGVTRGSFYWHFESREDLLGALLSEWRARNSGVMIEAIRNIATLDEGILALFAVWVDHKRFDPKLDQAIRDWARHDDEVCNLVKAEDDARIAAIGAFFERFGYAQPEAFIRARVIYFTQISYYALDVEKDETLTQRMGYLEAYFHCFTGRKISEDTARIFRKMHQSEDTE